MKKNKKVLAVIIPAVIIILAGSAFIMLRAGALGRFNEQQEKLRQIQEEYQSQFDQESGQWSC